MWILFEFVCTHECTHITGFIRRSEQRLFQKERINNVIKAEKFIGRFLSHIYSYYVQSDIVRYEDFLHAHKERSSENLVIFTTLSDRIDGVVHMAALLVFFV